MRHHEMTLYDTVVEAIAPTTKAVGAAAEPQNSRRTRWTIAAWAACSDILNAEIKSARQQPRVTTRGNHSRGVHTHDTHTYSYLLSLLIVYGHYSLRSLSSLTLHNPLLLLAVNDPKEYLLGLKHLHVIRVGDSSDSDKS